MIRSATIGLSLTILGFFKFRDAGDGRLVSWQKAVALARLLRIEAANDDLWLSGSFFTEGK
jgi:hypothetical protein